MHPDSTYDLNIESFFRFQKVKEDSSNRNFWPQRWSYNRLAKKGSNIATLHFSIRLLMSISSPIPVNSYEIIKINLT
jgi:hypothetical protein